MEWLEVIFTCGKSEGMLILESRAKTQDRENETKEIAWLLPASLIVLGSLSGRLPTHLCDHPPHSLQTSSKHRFCRGLCLVGSVVKNTSWVPYG